MGYRVADLTSELLDALPSACRMCTYWELGSPRESPKDASGGRAKRAWVRETEVICGPPGKILYDGDREVGYALMAPPERFRRSRLFVHHPSEDALLLGTAWIAPDARERGAGQHLVRAVLHEAHRRRCRAVEAYGVRGGSPEAPEGACVLSEAFLGRMGFQVLREHPHWPLMRLDLRQTVSDSMESALARVRRALRPQRLPAPARSSAVRR